MNKVTSRHKNFFNLCIINNKPIMVNNIPNTTNSVVSFIFHLFAVFIIAYFANEIITKIINYGTDKILGKRYLDSNYIFRIFVHLVIFVIIYGLILDILYPKDNLNIIIHPPIIYIFAVLVTLYPKNFINKSDLPFSTLFG
jgi:hypothetical protein